MFRTESRRDVRSALVVAVGLFFTGAPASLIGTVCPPPLFLGPSSSPGRVDAQPMGHGDFNGDGTPDIAAAVAYPSSGLQIFLGAGDGTFTLGASYFQATVIGPIGVADFNNDGRLDVAIGSAQDLLLLQGNGDGTFTQVPNNIFFSDWTTSVAAGDFNGDGNIDLAVGLQSTNSVQILLGNGDGTFSSPIAYSSGTSAGSLLVGDFDLDGALDIVACGTGSSSVSILFGRGDGTFDSAQQFLIGPGPISLIATDFNGDGKLDLAALLQQSGQVQALAVLLNAGNGQFFAPIDYPAPSSSTALAVGDFNEDTFPDLAVLEGNGSYYGPYPAELELLVGDGNGSFSPGPLWVAGQGGGTFLALDTNGDGHLDVVEGGNGSSNLWTLVGNGDGTFRSSFEVPVASPPASLTPTDINTDGKADLVVLETLFNGPVFLQVLVGNGSGDLSPGFSASLGQWPGGAGVGDFNGDGHLDLLGVGYGAGIASVYPGNGDGSFGAPLVTNIGNFYYYTSKPLVGDFNGDNKLDFLFLNGYGSPQTLSYLAGMGDGSFATPTTQSIAVNTPIDLQAGDLNGDGVIDLIIADGSTNVWVLLGHGDGTFADPVAYGVPLGSGSLALGDFNGDGRADLLVSDGSAEMISLLLGNGDGTFANAINIGMGEAPGQLIAADIDGDGLEDFAVVGSNDIWIYLGMGNGAFLSPEVFLTGAGASSLVAADLRGSGATDLLTGNTGDSSIGILLNGRLAVSGPIPASSGVCTGDTFSFNALASGLQPISYQWRRNGVNLSDGGEFSGTHTSTLTINPASVSDSASYDVVVSDSCSNLVSSEGLLAVNDRPPSPSLTAPQDVAVGAVNLVASVPPAAGATFDWSLTGGSITAGQGTDQIQFSAGSPGTTMLLEVIQYANAGCGSAPSTALIQVDFLDVPPSNPFHDFVDTLARDGVTAGCGGGNFCPTDAVLRSSMAVFLLRAEHGSTYVPPPAVGIFGDVPASNPFAPWIEQIYNESITGGCSTNPLEYCPNNSVTRAGMAVFLLRAEHGPTYTPPPAVGIFGDVPPSNPFAPWIEQLYNEGITGGCSTNPLEYCPGNAVTRAQMAVFLVATFNLQ